jgi:hypothetical protein
LGSPQVKGFELRPYTRLVDAQTPSLIPGGYPDILQP